MKIRFILACILSNTLFAFAHKPDPLLIAHLTRFIKKSITPDIISQQGSKKRAFKKAIEAVSLPVYSNPITALLNDPKLQECQQLAVNAVIESRNEDFTRLLEHIRDNAKNNTKSKDDEFYVICRNLFLIK